MTLPEFRRAVLVNLERCNEAKARPAWPVASRCPSHAFPPLSQASGNAFFAASDWENAKEKYIEALAQVGGALSVPALARQPEFSDLLRRCNAAHASCHLNLAACAARAGEHDTAADHCREALRVEPRRVKGHFRLAQARGLRRQPFPRL